LAEREYFMRGQILAALTAEMIPNVGACRNDLRRQY
jgi:hypothetical protein